MEILYFASSTLTLFFIVLLVGKKDKNYSDVILISWFFILLFNVFSFYLIEKQKAGPILVEFLDASAFLHGPILFFYTSALTGDPLKINLKNTFHFFPFILFFLLSVWITEINWKHISEYNYTLIFLKFLISLIYIGFSIKKIRNYRRNIANILSTVDQLELNWLMSILYGTIILMAFGGFTLIIHFFTSINIPQSGGKYLNIAYSLSIIVLGYFGLKQTAIFIPSNFRENKPLFDKQLVEEKTSKYGKSKLDDSFSEGIFTKLIQYMEIKKPYLDENLTLFKLAEQIGVSENNLSQVINSKSQYNFFDFINKYRVESFIERLKKGEHQRSTLLGLAFDSGFNSKASFNRSFRKHRGMSPSEFLKLKLR